MHDLFSMFKDEATIKIIAGTAWTAISFFCGAYVGHRFNLFRDKRKEFNDAAAPIRLILLNQLKAATERDSINHSISECLYWSLIDKTPKRKRRKLSSIWHGYLKSKENDYNLETDEAGRVLVKFKNRDNYISNINKFLKFTEPK
ncbi:hypothetical protein BET61_RS10075 [Morganella morganii]|nr:hypothetical protein [Morganella morganii]